MKEWLARIEAGLQNLIERTLERLAGGKIDAPAIAVRVVRAMESSLRRDRAGRSWAPDEYDLLLYPIDLEALQQETPDLEAFLKKAILQAVRDGGYSIAEEPRIALDVDPKMARNKVRVQAFHSRDTPAHTQQMPSLAHQVSADITHAGLVGVDGQVYPLGTEILNVGRLPDNQIVFKDPRVSRRHAQIRMREGRHVVFDLGSMAGTRVNGKTTMECVLKHGDVVTFAGNRVVYQIGETAPDDPGSGA